MARLSDYAKELSFWRDTIRKILVEQGQTLKDTDTIINNVTKSLKTYSTKALEDIESFESIKIAASLIHPQSNSTPDSITKQDKPTP
jgi:hypothetical protein